MLVWELARVRHEGWIRVESAGSSCAVSAESISSLTLLSPFNGAVCLGEQQPGLPAEAGGREEAGLEQEG